MRRKFSISIDWTPGEHSQEMMQACYRILQRYAKAQKNCCVCGKSRTMKHVKRLIAIYSKYSRRRLWDEVNFNRNDPKNKGCLRDLSTVWMRLVFRVWPSMWC